MHALQRLSHPPHAARLIDSLEGFRPVRPARRVVKRPRVEPKIREPSNLMARHVGRERNRPQLLQDRGKPEKRQEDTARRKLSAIPR